MLLWIQEQIRRKEIAGIRVYKVMVYNPGDQAETFEMAKLECNAGNVVLNFTVGDITIGDRQVETGETIEAYIAHSISELSPRKAVWMYDGERVS